MTSSNPHTPPPKSRETAIYIHWPFCESKCPYCDFNSHVRASIDEASWEKALVDELKSYGELLAGTQVGSLFFGGGTPSLMPPGTVQNLIETVVKGFKTSSDLEITLEANPNSIEAEKFQAFKQAGINRVSVGIQSLDDAELKFLGRLHSAAEAKAALKIARETFENFSFDLIYARPNQTVPGWTQELREALSYGSPHMSLYQLTIEPNTAFATRYKRGDFELPSEALGAQLYETTARITDTFGLKQYEISNYAQPGRESKHNTLYWTYGDYVGIGPGAHGRLSLQGAKHATKNYRAPETWLKSVQETGQGLQEKIPLSQAEMVDECLLMGLRLHQGFPEARLQELTGLGFQDVLNMETVSWLESQDLLVLQDAHLTLTPKGRLCLNTLLGEIIKP